MLDLLRDSTFGQFINWLTDGRLLPYRDQKLDYQIPKKYLSVHEDSSSKSPSPQPGESGGQPVEKLGTSDIEGGGLNTQERTPYLHLVDWDGDDDPDNPK